MLLHSPIVVSIEDLLFHYLHVASRPTSKDKEYQNDNERIAVTEDVVRPTPDIKTIF